MQVFQHPRLNAFSPRTLSLLIPLLAGMLPVTAALAQPPVPQNASHSQDEMPFTALASPVNLIERVAGNRSATFTVTAPKNSREMSVVFGKIKLTQGAYLQVFTRDKKQMFTYTDKAFYSDDGVADFESEAISATELIVRVVYPELTPADGDRLDITGYRALRRETSRMIVGTNQTKQAACYKTLNDVFYRHSHASAHTKLSTGWNVSGGPYMLSAHHVVGDIGEKKLTVVYNYLSEECDHESNDKSNALTLYTEAVVAAGKGPGAPDDKLRDWALYKVDALAWEEAGIVPFFGTLTLDTSKTEEQIKDLPVYIAQYPNFRPRQISSQHDDGSACRILGDNGNVVRYNCDTEGGASGSAVLSQQDSRVVALHYAGSSTQNFGTNINRVYEGIAHILPNVNVAETGRVGKGNVKVSTASLAPDIPLDVESGVSEAFSLEALDASRLQQDGDSYLFNAKGRAADGTIKNVNVRLTTSLKAKESGVSPLGLAIRQEDNPSLPEGVLSGWMAFSLNDKTLGKNIKNLVVPFSYESYDPFTSPFAPDADVEKITLTESKPVSSSWITHTSNFGFVVVRSGQGPLTLTGDVKGYTPLTVQVKDEAGRLQNVRLRAQRNTNCVTWLRPMNSMTGCAYVPQPAKLNLSYVAEDNEALPAGRYRGILPVLATRDEFSKPLLVDLDITVAPKENDKPQPAEHDFVFPAGLKDYKAGTKVLQPTTGKVYQCKPWPYSGYCVQWSASSRQFEPGFGSSWKTAWNEVK